MKKLGIFGKLLFWVNSIVVFLLFLAFFLPYVAPSTSPTLSILSLAVSPLLWLNLLFLIYWLLRRKRVFVLSGIAVLIAYFIFDPFYKISSQAQLDEYEHTLSILSYNVRLFNLYETDSKTKEASAILTDIIHTKNPDILCLQEYILDNETDFSAYAHRFSHFKKNHTLGHAILSKYPIINKGTFDFKGTGNNVLFADIVKGNDTIRIYNLHLQSIGIKPSMEKLQEEDKQKVRRRLSDAFIKQEEQANRVKAHLKKSPFNAVLAGDFNNTPYSYVYRMMTDDMVDAFLERGNGLGTTFNFDFYPMRIDYIFASEKFEVLNFDRLKTTFSDHYPIYAALNLEVED